MKGHTTMFLFYIMRSQSVAKLVKDRIFICSSIETYHYFKDVQLKQVSTT